MLITIGRPASSMFARSCKRGIIHHAAPVHGEASADDFPTTRLFYDICTPCTPKMLIASSENSG